MVKSVRTKEINALPFRLVRQEMKFKQVHLNGSKGEQSQEGNESGQIATASKQPIYRPL